METLIFDLKRTNFYREYIETAASALREGELVAFPTDTVYGLGANRNNPVAVERIFEVKKRPEEKKLTLMIAEDYEVKKYVDPLPPVAQKLMEVFWPGALTIIFPLKDGSNISIRLPDNYMARDLIRTARIPVVTTSANISGCPPAKDAQEVITSFKGKIRVILDGGTCLHRLPSTVVQIKDDDVDIIRHGVITETRIRSFLENRRVNV